MMTKITKKILFLLGLIIMIGGSYLIYKDYKEDLRISCTSDSKNNDSNLSYVYMCMQRAKLYNQEQYDAYYNIAVNNPPLSIIEDDIFYQGFDLAYRNCGFDSKPYACNRRNEKIIEEFVIKCTANAKKVSLCTDYYYRNHIPTKDNVKYFVNIIKKQIKENEFQKWPKNWSCSSKYKNFYAQIGKDLIYLVPLEIQNVCKS